MVKTFKEAAEEYEHKKTANIADLDKFDISEPIEERTGKDNDGKEFKYNVLIRDGEDYRVPNTVLETVKGILVANEKHDKKVSTFSVEKTGEGMGTKYQVISLD
jgi:hypothetical protein